MILLVAHLESAPSSTLFSNYSSFLQSIGGKPKDIKFLA